jgi:hypothetical protein
VAWPPEYPPDVLWEIQNSQKVAGLGNDLFFYLGHENDGVKSCHLKDSLILEKWTGAQPHQLLLPKFLPFLPSLPLYLV